MNLSLISDAPIIAKIRASTVPVNTGIHPMKVKSIDPRVSTKNKPSMLLSFMFEIISTSKRIRITKLMIMAVLLVDCPVIIETASIHS